MKTGAENSFKKYMDELTVTGEGLYVVIGVSGGADSICLLFLMLDLLGPERIRVVHVNHMIRGGEADGDAAFVRDLCRSRGIFFREVKEDIPLLARNGGCTVEEAGRKLRYERFAKEAGLFEKEEGLKKGTVRIAIAHHLEDSAETFLFNLFRGSGIRGLSGISPQRGAVIRPLIGVTREEIEEYLRVRGISFRKDSTNDDSSYARNRIRNEILPESKRINSASIRHIAAASEKIRAVCDYLDETVEKAAAGIVTEDPAGVYRISRRGFDGLPEVIARMLVCSLLTKCSPMKKDIGEVHTESVMKLAKGPSGKHADLPYGITADAYHDEIVLKSPNADKTAPSPEYRETNVKTVMIKGSDLSSYDRKVITNPKDPGNRYTKFFDYDKIIAVASGLGITKEPFFEIRPRRDHDRITIKKSDGTPGTKSLSDLLTDLKLTPEEKDRIRVMAVGSEVLWVIGYRMGDSAKLSDETVNILKAEAGN